MDQQPKQSCDEMNQSNSHIWPFRCKSTIAAPPAAFFLTLDLHAVTTDVCNVRKEAKSEMTKPKEAPPGYRWIFRPWITRPDGTRVYASSYGKRAFRLLVPVV